MYMLVVVTRPTAVSVVLVVVQGTESGSHRIRTTGVASTSLTTRTSTMHIAASTITIITTTTTTTTAAAAASRLFYTILVSHQPAVSSLAQHPAQVLSGDGHLLGFTQPGQLVGICVVWRGMV